MGTKNPPESDPVTPYEKQAELKRILESKYFAKAPKRRLFLEFTTGHVLRGEGDKLNEYLIGVEVYERGSDFDPQQDPIVRVQAHEIRRALKTYYLEEGKNSPLKIDLPAGQYAPLFTRAKPDATVAAGAADSAGPSPAVVAARRGIEWRNALLVFLSLACATLGLLYMRERGVSHTPMPSAAALPESEEWFWKPFLVPGSQPLVVVPTQPVLRLVTDADTPQTLKQGYAIPKLTMPAFRDTFHFLELKNFVFVPTPTDYTGIGEAVGLADLANLLSSQGVTFRVKTSRLTDYTEIQGGNTIMLGGATHWTNRVFENPHGFSLYEGAFKNNSAPPGANAVFASQFDPVTNHLTRDYALVVMRPNGAKKDRLLLLYGLCTQGTQGAAEYVTNGERLVALRTALLDASPDKKTLPAFFEALLSVPVENYVPGGASLVALRIITE